MELLSLGHIWTHVRDVSLCFVAVSGPNCMGRNENELNMVLVDILNANFFDVLIC